MKRNIFASVIILLVVFGTVRGQAQDLTTSGVEVEVQGFGKVIIPDIIVQDQDGQKSRFYSDLVKDKVVVINFFYTSCAYICTLQGRTFSKLQSLLGERLGKSVFLISVSTDPANDNSAQLKQWSKRYDVQTGWTLVTGSTAEMNKLLLPFTAKPASGGMHLPVTFIGNARTGVWTGATGTFAPEDLLKVVNFISR
jgi:Uncharacterized protein SCO1/SenC/PrrC, involved in biogenesis of respiratory and photosynthetic systems